MGEKFTKILQPPPPGTDVGKGDQKACGEADLAPPQDEHATPNPTHTQEAPQQTQEDTKYAIRSRALVSCTPNSSLQCSQHSTNMEEYMDYPILQDMETKDYVQNCKVLVIMKGLPGSGKSSITAALEKAYSDVTVCSADSHFMKGVDYEYNAEEIKPAHEACRKKAQEAAEKGSRMIIIDNTNLRAWNYKDYLGLTKRYHYTPVILEPQTPWAMDPKELCKRTRHGVSEKILAQKLESYEKPLPLYYWWFLNEADSSQILTMAQEWLKRSLQVQEFFCDFAEFSGLSSDEDILKYYTRSQDASTYKVLHATACATRRGKADKAMEYIESSAVKDSLGKSFSFHIIGFVITPRTFGARLKLGEEALKVWGMNDDEIELEDASTDTPSQQSTTEADSADLNNTGLRRDACSSTISNGPSQLHNNRFCPTAGKGSRAHLTLGCAPKVHAKVTGFDLIKVVSYEQSIKSEQSFEDLHENTIKTYSIPEGKLRTYGNNVWVIYPEEEVIVSSLFSAFY